MLRLLAVGEPFPPTALQRRHAQTVREYVIVIKNFLNPKEHQNPINGSKVTAILLKGWIFPIGGASAGEGLHLQPVQQAFFPVAGAGTISISKHV